jgi:beta-barrel assembly-enhancing protease
MRKRLIVILVLSALVLLAQGRKLPKAGWNLFSKQQDIQLGREASQQMEQQLALVNDRELTEYVNRIGQRLVRDGKLEEYPYFFKVVQEDSINAFAFPGGPMYVHTGLMRAAENEAQLAGVLAHELSHVVLRHGTAQVSKAQGFQILAMIGGAALGGGGSMTGALAQLGIGVGLNSVMMKYSRNAERDADLLGMHAMSRAGYNPVEMARFFEKLEAESGKQNALVAAFFSSHPSPGSRVKSVEKEVPYLPRSEYGRTEGDLNRMKQAIEKLPPAPKRQQPGAGAPGQAAPPPQTGERPQISLSGRMQSFSGGGVRFDHPEGWERVGSDQNAVTLAPRGGVVQGQGGSYSLGYGIIVSAIQPEGRLNLANQTQQLLRSLAQNNPGGRVEGRSERITIDRSNALVSRMSAESPYKGARENIVVITVDRRQQMYYFIFVAPDYDFQRLEPAFQQVTQTIRFQ